MPVLTRLERDTLNQVSANLGINPPDLERLVQFESKWNPSIKNPLSSARGLLQFTDKTARSMGYTGSLDLVKKNPSRSGQLKNAVFPYLKRYSPFPNKQALAMSVFMPALRYSHPETVFPEWVRRSNPGIEKVKDYVNKVYPGLYYNMLPKILFWGVIAFLSFNALKKGGRINGTI